MEKLNSHISETIPQLRSNKKQSNESAIMAHLSEELEKLNIDKKRPTERFKWLVEYKKLDNKPRNGVTHTLIQAMTANVQNHPLHLIP